MTARGTSGFNKRLIQKGKLFFWLGSLMSSSALTWFFEIARYTEITADAIVLPATFLGLGIMLAIGFKECQFRQK
jgi:Na+-translocating ferredoxin:NAD+ oxidoreductase RnfE subunit